VIARFLWRGAAKGFPPTDKDAHAIHYLDRLLRNFKGLDRFLSTRRVGSE
jgi:hypothetical protein